jgi:hypothetical protein
MTAANRLMVANSIDRYCFSDRSGLVPNVDGSIDIYIQNAPPPDMSSGMIEAWRIFHFYGGGLDAGSISQSIPAAGSIRAAWVSVSMIRCLKVDVLINLT